ncbi:MAG: hypothetical protein V4591_11375 [Bdellovibrionota bacterium]
MKKILGIFGLAALALTACGKKDNSSNPAGDSAETATIKNTVWLANPNETAFSTVFHLETDSAGTYARTCTFMPNKIDTANVLNSKFVTCTYDRDLLVEGNTIYQQDTSKEPTFGPDGKQLPWPQIAYAVLGGNGALTLLKKSTSAYSAATTTQVQILNYNMTNQGFEPFSNDTTHPMAGKNDLTTLSACTFINGLTGNLLYITCTFKDPRILETDPKFGYTWYETFSVPNISACTAAITFTPPKVETKTPAEDAKLDCGAPKS